MRKIILACDDNKLAVKIKQSLAITRFHISYTCTSGAETLARASSLSGGLVICSRLTDMPVETLERLLPTGFGLIILLYPGQVYGGKSKALKLPVRKSELLKEIEIIAEAWNENFWGDYIKVNRNDEEQAVIEKAKAILMSRQDITENEAHKLLQKRSMHLGKKLVDVAKGILSQ